MHAIVNFERAEVLPFCSERGLATCPRFLKIIKDVSSHSSAEKKIKTGEVKSYYFAKVMAKEKAMV